MANLKAGVIVPITLTSDYSGNIKLYDEPVFTAVKNGSSIELTMKIIIQDSKIIADDEYDEEYLKQNSAANFKFIDGSTNEIGIRTNYTQIALSQSPRTNRYVYFDFRTYVDDGKVGGASLFTAIQKNKP
jgi:hypothetical protein